MGNGEDKNKNGQNKNYIEVNTWLKYHTCDAHVPKLSEAS